ncbi:MAG: LamG-like jellyroll fold domain-containing protein [Flammeovirgaceae bacterium]
MSKPIELTRFENKRYLNIESALSFDGVDDELIIPHEVKLSTLNISKPWTISCFVKVENFTNFGGAGRYIVRKFINPTNQISVNVNESVITINIRSNNAATFSNTAYNKSYFENKWVHLVVSNNAQLNDSERIKAFLNGTQISLPSSNTSSPLVDIDDADLIIGDNNFGGQLAHFALFAKALAVSEIQFIQRNVGHLPRSAATYCVGYWPLQSVDYFPAAQNIKDGASAIPSQHADYTGVNITLNSGNVTASGATWEEAVGIERRNTVGSRPEINDNNGVVFTYDFGQRTYINKLVTFIWANVDIGSGDFITVAVSGSLDDLTYIPLGAELVEAHKTDIENNFSTILLNEARLPFRYYRISWNGNTQGKRPQYSLLLAPDLRLVDISNQFLPLKDAPWPFFTVETTSQSPDSFTATVAKDNAAPIWQVNDNGSRTWEEGLSVSHEFQSTQNKTVTLFFDDPSEFNQLVFNNQQIQGIVDLSSINDASLLSINLDGNSALTGVLFGKNITVGTLSIRLTELTGVLDLSEVTVTSQLFLNEIGPLTQVIHPTAPQTIPSYNVRSNSLAGILDLSNITITGFFSAADNIGITEVIHANTQVTLATYQMHNTSITQLDLTNIGISGSFAAYNCANLTTITHANFPHAPTSYNASNCPSLTSINFGQLSFNSMTDLNLSNNNFTAAQVNQILVDILAATTATDLNEAVFNFTGNALYDTTSGGLDGEAAANALIAKNIDLMFT